MTATQIKLKRVYDGVSDNDGLRILVERLWPRGLTKAKASIDHWAKDVAPTPALRIWFGHRLERWDDFQDRYCLELIDNPAAVNDLLARCQRQPATRPTTFVFAAKDSEHNGAVVLRDFLLSQNI